MSEVVYRSERVHGFFARSCPLYRSLSPAIAITTELVIAAGQRAAQYTWRSTNDGPNPVPPPLAQLNARYRSTWN